MQETDMPLWQTCVLVTIMNARETVITMSGGNAGRKKVPTKAHLAPHLVFHVHFLAPWITSGVILTCNSD